jgi:hypothetical protein
VRLRLWLTVVLLASPHIAHGQVGGRLAEVEVGFRGTPVADAWNPLRVTVRDVGSGSLTLVADQGNLRDGEIPWTMVVPITGGAGVRVLEVDVFLPAWRSLVWSLEAGGTIVASGALPREAADRRRLDLVVSARPGAVAERLAGRVVDIVATALPARAAAYDGVRSLWIDGSAGIPAAAAMTAAAAAGAVVVLAADALRDPAVAELVGPGADWVPIAAGGWWVGAPPDGAQLESARVDLGAYLAAFSAAGGAIAPRTVSVSAVLLAASTYVVLVMLAWRVGGVPGLLTWSVLLLGASLLAWGAPRPASPTLVESRALHVGVGDLAWRTEVHDLLTLPAGEVGVARVARPATTTAGEQRLGSPPGTMLTLPRWRGATLVEAPRAAPALLAIDTDGLPIAVGDRVLTDVRIVGGAAWHEVAPGRAPGPPSEPLALGGNAAAFEALLPPGSAWARDGADWHVALAAEVRW